MAGESGAQVAVAAFEGREGVRQQRVDLLFVQAQHAGDDGRGARLVLRDLLTGDEELGDHPARVRADAHRGAGGEFAAGLRRRAHCDRLQAMPCCSTEIRASVDSAP